jgi:hypothetical protein
VIYGLAALALVPLSWRRPHRERFDAGLGRPLPAATLQGLDGTRVEVASLLGRRGLVVVFLGTHCPVGNQSIPKLNALASLARSKALGFIGVNANASETAEQVAAHAREFKLAFPVLKDSSNTAADRWRVGRTNEALLLDGSGILRYRGAVDDEFRTGVRKGGAIQPLLSNALAAMIAGRPIAVATTPVFGCPIERQGHRARAALPRVRAAAPAIVSARQAAGPGPDVGAVTYAADVAPILAARCQSCHRPRQVAPFSLLSYQDAKRWASSIAEAVEDYRMPPWHADPRHGRFANDRSLTARERAVLMAWVEQGTPPGDLRASPPPPAFPEGWSIGTPDLVFTMDEPFEVPASGVVPIQRFRVRCKLDEDCWVQQAEMQPGDREVVHHMFVFVEPHREDRDDVDRTGPCLVAYAPGDAPTILPAGIAKRIPAGSDLLFEIHYTPIGKARVDRSSVGLILAREPVHHEAAFLGVADKQLVLAPGESNHLSRSLHVFEKNVHILSLFPHMHLRGKDFRFEAVFPDGRRMVLLSVPAYDFAWQSVYRLAEPLALPAGSRIECEAHFDNSAANAANPDPKATVRWGDQTWDEMMIGYIDYYEDRAASGPLARGPVDPGEHRRD